uniref:Uncharacterized protein n=1 Tax=Rhizophora mucronata TaxID=61149 RepID=A0A2P2INB8_RHIMU
MIHSWASLNNLAFRSNGFIT